MIKQERKSLVDKGNEKLQEILGEPGPITQKINDKIDVADAAVVNTVGPIIGNTVGAAKNMFKMLKSITRVGK